VRRMEGGGRGLILRAAAASRSPPPPLPVARPRCAGSLAPMYYRGAQAAVVVFDVTSRESFEGAKQVRFVACARAFIARGAFLPHCRRRRRRRRRLLFRAQWVRELQKKMDAGVVIALAANKVDLAGRRKVDRDEAEMYAREMGLLYAETSAKDATNIDQLFIDVALRVPKSTAPSPAQKDVDLAGRKDGAPAKAAGGCCG